VLRLRSLAAAALIASSILAPRAAPLAQDTPIVDGEVTAVELSAGRITIRHGPIKNLGMTGVGVLDTFKVGDPIMLNAVQPGVKIRFTADRIDGQLTITAIRP
jgi:Cu(I)/Ag(I) efflux system protein CusF